MKKQKIIGGDWDYLIILDACRYDYFKKVYREFFDRGKLKRVVSSGRTTMEWLNKNFNEYHEEIVYFSSNPYINSKTETSGQYGFKFDGKKYFFEIIDIWASGWNKNFGTVLPETVNNFVLKKHKKHVKKKFIIHYMQPHKPFISKNHKKYFLMGSISGIKNNKKNKNKVHKLILKTITGSLKSKIERIIGKKKLLKTAILLGFVPTPSGYILLEEGKEGLRNAYKENLELVLESVSELTKELSGKIIITADHGEYLGEGGIFGHGKLPKNPPILNVPWFEIKNP